MRCTRKAIRWRGQFSNWMTQISGSGNEEEAEQRQRRGWRGWEMRASPGSEPRPDVYLWRSCMRNALYCIFSDAISIVAHVSISSSQIELNVLNDAHTQFPSCRPDCLTIQIHKIMWTSVGGRIFMYAYVWHFALSVRLWRCRCRLWNDLFERRMYYVIEMVLRWFRNWTHQRHGAMMLLRLWFRPKAAANRVRPKTKWVHIGISSRTACTDVSQCHLTARIQIQHRKTPLHMSVAPWIVDSEINTEPQHTASDAYQKFHDKMNAQYMSKSEVRRFIFNNSTQHIKFPACADWLRDRRDDIIFYECDNRTTCIKAMWCYIWQRAQTRIQRTKILADDG